MISQIKEEKRSSIFHVISDIHPNMPNKKMKRYVKMIPQCVMINKHIYYYNLAINIQIGKYLVEMGLLFIEIRPVPGLAGT